MKYKVYTKLDEFGRVIAINSDAFLKNKEGWNYIDEGYTDQFHHAQANYLPHRLIDDAGRFNYKMVDGLLQLRTEEEKSADNIEDKTPTLDQRLAALEAMLEKVFTLLGVNKSE